LISDNNNTSHSQFVGVCKCVRKRSARLQICIKSGSHICKSTLHTVYETIACLCNGIFHAPCFLIPAPPPMRRLFHVQWRLCGKTRVSVLQLVTDCLTIVSVVSMQKNEWYRQTKTRVGWTDGKTDGLAYSMHHVARASRRKKTHHCLFDLVVDSNSTGASATHHKDLSKYTAELQCTCICFHRISLEYTIYLARSARTLV